ncbi:MAG: MotA/TolQ/ExbB proton channel family protein [Betaproteobacteria bacterium]|nr:MotA/TolQ/ExbB proton channel family protein [Betaproteobacteria bacterium]
MVVGLLGSASLATHAQTPLPPPATDSAAASTGATATATTGVGTTATQAAGASAASSAESTANPYGIGALWAQGDFVARGTLLILILMSMGTWYVLITKLIEQGKILKQAQAIDDEFWSSGAVNAKIQALDEDSPFRYIGDKALQSANKFSSVSANVDLHTWLGTSVQRTSAKVQGRLQMGLAVLATVGSTGPFVGLFGTVWGIYHALVSIGISGQASIDKVAGPVGEALIMTAIGLAVAVPAVLGYNWLVRRNKEVMEAVSAFSGELHSALLAHVKR